jgi:hypothetical protein
MNERNITSSPSVRFLGVYEDNLRSCEVPRVYMTYIEVHK